MRNYSRRTSAHFILSLAALGLTALPAAAVLTTPLPHSSTTNGVTTLYGTDPGNYQFVVPATGVTSVKVSLWGGGGGIGFTSGGVGGYLTGTLTVLPNTTYTIIIGSNGSNGSNGGAGGTPDGNAGKADQITPGGGGGSSSFAFNSTTLGEAPGGAGGSGGNIVNSAPVLDPNSGGAGGGSYITTGLTGTSQSGQFTDPTWHTPASTPGQAGEVSLVYSTGTPAPEPSALATFALGVLGLGALTLKARRRTA